VYRPRLVHKRNSDPLLEQVLIRKDSVSARIDYVEASNLRKSKVESAFITLHHSLWILALYYYFTSFFVHLYLILQVIRTMPKSAQIGQRSDICRYAIRELPEKIPYWEVYCSTKNKFVFKLACDICPRFETFPEQCARQVSQRRK